MIKFVDFKKHVAEGPLEPVYLIMGDDAYLRESALAMLTKLVDMPELNISCYDDDSDIEEMTLNYSQLPMMSKYKLMKCTVVNKSIKEIERFLGYVCKNKNPDTLVVFTQPSLVSCIAANIKGFTVVDCSRLDKPMLIKWLAAESKKRGASISSDAASLLCDYCLNLLTRIDVEFDKLISLCDGRMIDEKDVAANVVPDGDFKIYELGDALAKKDVDRTYRIYDSLIVNTAPVAILGALYSHFRRMLYSAVSTCDRESLARYLKVKPYAVEMASRQAKMYSPKRLKKIVDKLSNIDADFKSGLVSDRLALDVFIADTLCAA